MGITIDEILMLAGRLDDAPGFDSPRERFRRFLLAHVSTAQIARSLIEQCQHTPGEQHQRALQDLVVLLGRFIGFETTFGTYAPLTGGVKYEGHWQSRSQLHIVVEVRSDQAAGPGLESLLRSVAALATTSPAQNVRAAGLCVLASPYVGRRRAEETAGSAQSAFPVGVVSLRSLLSLADMVSAGSVTHDDVVRMLEFNIPADFVVELLERRQPGSPVEILVDASLAPAPVADEPRFWIAPVGSDHATKPEEFLELVVGKRRIFGLTGDRTGQGAAGTGDGICFYIAGKGAVGHARVASLADDGSSIRDAHRFRQLLHLDEVRLYLDAPVALDVETDLQLRSAAPAGSRLSHTLVRISRESFMALTSRSEQPAVETTAVADVPAAKPAPESTAAAVRAPAIGPSKRRR